MKKNKIEKFLKNNEKQTLKILRRFFGIKSIATAIEEERVLKEKLEIVYQKEIDLITWPVIKSNYSTHNAYLYAKYLTLRTIITQYLENKKLYPYTNDLEEVINEF